MLMHILYYRPLYLARHSMWPLVYRYHVKKSWNLCSLLQATARSYRL